MKKFDGYLICSDWDGTLSYNGTVSEENVKAIKYFQENGGLFTICTGRHYQYIRDYYHFVKPNTAVISLCGTLIYDEEACVTIHEGFANEPKMPLIDRIMQYPDVVTHLWVCYEGCSTGDVISAGEYIKYREKIEKTRIHKIVFVTETESKMQTLVNDMKDADLNGNLLVRSWPTGIEIYSAASSKGPAAQFLKERTNSHTLICVGDYENDIDMIEAADIGYAVANAVDGVKAVADRITVDFRESALAKIISDIDAEISATK